MTIRMFIIGLTALGAPALAMAQGALHFPEGSVRGYEKLQTASTIDIAVGPYRAGQIKTAKAEGTVLREVWTTPINGDATEGLINTLRTQLTESGYGVLFQCETRSCGGFDFRFNADILDEPEMHVDLGNFRYLCATRTIGGKPEYVSLLVSRSPDRGFVQMTKVVNAFDPGSTPQPVVEVSTKQGVSGDGRPIGGAVSELLLKDGAAVLEGLEFKQGASGLSGNPAESLRDLAAFLKDNPKKTVILVGHTDASGSLEGNIALSRKRAESVAKRLVETYGTDPAQVTSEGIGYLSPRASNTTKEGRDKNRRVEVVLTSIN